LGWEPRAQLKEGLQKSLDYFRSKIGHGTEGNRP